MENLKIEQEGNQKPQSGHPIAIARFNEFNHSSNLLQEGKALTAEQPGALPH